MLNQHLKVYSNRELFIQWYAWSIKYKDCDPAVWMTNYLFDRFEFNREQKLWFCWIYGNTYHLPTAWLIWNEFPDYELATFERIDAWNSKNFKKLHYQTDTKYNKGHLPLMFKSYKELIGEGTQQEFFERLGAKNKYGMYELIKNDFTQRQHKFGRYTIWFYAQHLKHCAKMKIESSNLHLHDYSGSRSHRNGLMYAISMPDLIDEKLDINCTLQFEAEAQAILRECKSRFPEHYDELDFFTMETCLCSFKKLFRAKRGRYLGYYLDRQSEEIMQIEKDGWVGIDWNVLWQAREETLDSRLSGRNKIRSEWFSDYVDRKEIRRMDWMFPFEKKKTGLEMFT